MDHSSQAQAEESYRLVRLPAQSVTAGQLMTLEEQQRRRFIGKGCEPRIKTGCQEIDNYVLCRSEDKLVGGFERGVVVGMSAADGNESAGSRLVSLNLIASILLQHIELMNCGRDSHSGSRNTMKPKVVVIDTSGSFSLPLLVRILRSRILKIRSEMRDRQNTDEKSENDHISDEVGIEKQVNTLLELVAISRVFDVEGLWEVLSEIGRTQVPSWKDEPNEKQAEPLHRLPDEIGDSEEEDIDILIPPPVKAMPPTTSEVETSPEILIIDSMHYLISQLFTHSETTSAHNLLSLLSRTLRTLTHTQNILAILHNSTISTNTKYTKPATRQPPPPAIQSIFTSTAQKPSLGRIFDDFLDMHIMISKMPKSRGDAEVLYGQDENLQNLEVDYCLVFEVLKDECPILGEDRKFNRRFGDREQRWGLFEIDSDGTELVGAFRDEVDGGWAGHGSGLR